MTAVSNNRRPLIDANIRKLGFKTEDVKLIVNSHGHFDHAAGIAALQRVSGATVAASASGAKALEAGDNTPDDPQCGFPKGFIAFPPVKNVKVIKDGEVQRVGKLAITPIFTPGHTPGSTTLDVAVVRRQPLPEHGLRGQHLARSPRPGFKFTEHPDADRAVPPQHQRLGELPCDIIVSTHPSATQISTTS